MASFVPPAKREKHRLLPPEVRQAILDAKREHPPLNVHELTTISWARHGHRPSSHTVKRILAEQPSSPRTHRRFPPYHAITDPTQRRLAVVRLHVEGWNTSSIAAYLETSRQTVHTTLNRWAEEEFAGLPDKSRAPHRRGTKVTLRAIATVKELQANPELGEFRIHAALEQQGIHLSPRTCGRILALHRALGAPQPAVALPQDPRPMPFAAQRRHQYWSVDVRSIEDHGLATRKPVYAISILENFSRALLASAISPRQDLTASLIVLRDAIETHGAPEVLVSDSGGVFKANHARAISAALGIAHRQIDSGQPWQNFIETHFNVMRRMADYHAAQATSWAELPVTHERCFHDYNQQAHFAHRERADGRHSPAAVLGWVQGIWCEPADLDRLFRLRAMRVLNAHGCVRFRHWRLYGERGLAGERAAVWLWDETLTIEHAAETLAQYRVAAAADGRLREVADPRFFTTGHASPQPFLAPLDETDWYPAQRMAPYRPRRKRISAEQHAPLSELERAASNG